MKTRYKPLYLRKNSWLYKAWQATTTILVAAVFILAMLLAGIRLIGYTPFYILSGSMLPTYDIGDLVYVKSVDPEQIEVGDVITYVYDESLTVVTHRVAAVDREQRFFITQGDANNVVDGNPVLYENVLGVAGMSIPGLGYLSAYLVTPSGRYTAITVILGLLILLMAPELMKKDREPPVQEDSAP